MKMFACFKKLIFANHAFVLHDSLVLAIRFYPTLLICVFMFVGSYVYASACVHVCMCMCTACS